LFFPFSLVSHDKRFSIFLSTTLNLTPSGIPPFPCLCCYLIPYDFRPGTLHVRACLLVVRHRRHLVPASSVPTPPSPRSHTIAGVVFTAYMFDLVLLPSLCILYSLLDCGRRTAVVFKFISFARLLLSLLTFYAFRH